MQKYLSFIKFSHTIFALPFAAIGFFLAYKNADVTSGWTIAVRVLLCMVFARNAAMAFNRYADRHIDKKNPRTAGREIPVGKISPGFALAFSLLNAAAFILTTFFINRLCFYLSPIALLLILGYSFTKRFTSFSHFVLGAGLSLAPIGAYLSVTGSFSILPVLFSVAVLMWVSGFDIIYALQDTQFDKESGLRSIPSVVGDKSALRISVFLHLLCIFSICMAGWMGVFGISYWLGCLFFTVMIIYQHLVVKPGDLSKINLAFFTLNGLASLIFSIFVILDILV